MSKKRKFIKAPPKAAPRRPAPPQKQKKKAPPPPPAPALNPFSPHLTTLLLGEGDFSFAAALHRSPYSPRVLTATSYDPLPAVLTKYPTTAPAHLEVLSTIATTTTIPAAAAAGVHHSIDATKLHSYRPLRRKGGYDIAAFLFPHVGGVTKDQDRQCRANQELLLGFFRSVKSVLAEKGRVVVTLFEGAAYEAWDIRGLAKREGFVGVTSGRFEPELWKGYKHARTLGEIEGGGGWKGEERKARLYIFCRKGEEQNVAKSSNSKKRKKGNESSDDEDDGNDDG